MVSQLTKRNLIALLLAALSASLGYAAGERHPEIHKAINKLRVAKNDLEHAAHDFGGHRAAAVRHIDEALSELEQALQFDKK